MSPLSVPMPVEKDAGEDWIISNHYDLENAPSEWIHIYFTTFIFTHDAMFNYTK